ncbi:hypothetical protein VP01_2190g1 [Puccinia sorghi]|uniref:Uncharacterized protein n=1 Tax=Puccinia sorghi TaxID=27349 RepID=A0A0L6V919_9BASI|nr:hypothetical protein VP01_2190g1 [Puccinia sorghi]
MFQDPLHKTPTFDAQLKLLDVCRRQVQFVSLDQEPYGDPVPSPYIPQSSIPQQSTQMAISTRPLLRSLRMPPRVITTVTYANNLATGPTPALSTRSPHSLNKPPGNSVLLRHFNTQHPSTTLTVQSLWRQICTPLNMGTLLLLSLFPNTHYLFLNPHLHQQGIRPGLMNHISLCTRCGAYIGEAVTADQSKQRKVSSRLLISKLPPAAEGVRAGSERGGLVSGARADIRGGSGGQESFRRALQGARGAGGMPKGVRRLRCRGPEEQGRRRGSQIGAVLQGVEISGDLGVRELNGSGLKELRGGVAGRSCGEELQVGVAGREKKE